MVKQFLFATLLAVAFPTLANVTATLSQDEISEFESVQLTIRLDGLAPREQPDFSALNKDFFVDSTQKNSTTRIYNNNFISVAEWTLVLRPKRITTLTIPVLKIGNFTTEELSLKVVPMSEELHEKLDQEVFFVTSVDRQEQYVHGAIHVERKLYYSVNVNLGGIGRRRGVPPPEDMDNAHIVNLGSQGSNWVTRNGRSYNLLTQEFVIFAEQSGTLTLPVTTIVANVSIDDRRITVRVRTEAEELTILPRPEEYPKDSPWLPASNVLIADDIGQLDLSDLVVGDSFSRLVTIEALESYSTGIPGIAVELPEEIRTYPVTPEFRNEILVNKIIGSRTDEQAFVVTQAGEFQIPDAELVWWNTNTKQVERTVVPGRSFTVSANPNATLAPPLDDPRSNESSLLPNDNNTPNWMLLPIWVIILALAGWSLSLIFAGMWIWDRRKEQKHTTSDSAEDVRLEALLKSDSGRDVKEGMLHWLTSKLAINRVNAIHLLQENPTTAAVLRSVNAYQYGTSGIPIKPNRAEIKHALKDIVQQFQEQRSHTTSYWQFYQPT